MKFILIIFLFFISINSFSEVYEVKLLKGKLQILRDNKIVPPPVKTGDRVTVSKGGIVILKSENTTLKLSGSSVIEPFEENEKTVINLIQGAIVSKVKKKSFEIKTKNAVFGVRGTEFFVSTNKEEQSWMCVKEGTVNAKSLNQNIDVSAGLGVFVGRGGVSKPEAFKWTKGINWEVENANLIKEHNVNLKYDLLEQFYD